MASRRSLGFTLVESLLALALTAMVLLGAGSMSLALSRSARDTEVNLQVQRDLVFAVESIQAHLRVATSWEALDAPVAPVNSAEFIKGYRIWGREYTVSGGYQDVLLTNVQLARGNRLFVGQRLVSSRIASVELSDDDLPPYMAEIYVESLDSLPFVSAAHLPMALRLIVTMRNSIATAPRMVSGPTVSGITSTSAIISWTADAEHAGYVQFWEKGDESKSKTIDAFPPSLTHSVELLGLSKEVLVSYRVFIYDNLGRPLMSASSSFMTLKK